MLLLQFLDKRLQELLLRLHLFDLSFDFESDPLLHAPLMHFVAANLCEQLHVAQGAEDQAALVEVLAEFLAALLFFDLLRVFFPAAEKLLRLVRIAPLVDPCHDNRFIAVTLNREAKHQLESVGEK